MQTERNKFREQERRKKESRLAKSPCGIFIHEDVVVDNFRVNLPKSSSQITNLLLSKIQCCLLFGIKVVSCMFFNDIHSAAFVPLLKLKLKLYLKCSY